MTDDVRRWIGRLLELEAKLHVRHVHLTYIDELVHVRSWWIARSWAAMRAPTYMRDDLVLSAMQQARLLGVPCWGEEHIESEDSLGAWAAGVVARCSLYRVQHSVRVSEHAAAW